LIKPCPELAGGYYIGFRSGHYFEHLIYKRGKVVKVRACPDCPITRLIQVSHIIAPPRSVNGYIRLVVALNNAVNKLISYYGPKVVKVDVMDLRGAIVTDNQRDVLGVVAELGISEAARRVGKSKTAVRKLFKSAIRKLVELYA